jgi:hypothetical protein
MIEFNKNSLSVNPFFLQKIENLKYIENRKNLFSELCKNKSVLHIGCTDYPFRLNENNLHLYLNTLNLNKLDGMDTDITGIEELKNVIPGKYFTDLKDIYDYYDLVLVPETIEHVPNIQKFIEDLCRINFKYLLITAPCFFNEMKNNEFGFVGSDYYEIVHPDHKAWFTPYTLKNCITQYSNLQIKECYILEHGHMVGVLAER